MSPDKIKKAFEAEFIHGDWDLRLGGYQDRFLEVCTNLTVELIEDHVINNHKSRPLEGKKVKEIALEAALRNKPIYTPINYGQISHPPTYNIVDEAEKIYKWLIKE